MKAPWSRYGNLAENSGVTHFRIAADSIDIRFRHDRVYRYSAKQPGRKDVERMKRLALAGKGLSTFISTHIKDRYECEID